MSGEARNGMGGEVSRVSGAKGRGERGKEEEGRKKGRETVKGPA